MEKIKNCKHCFKPFQSRRSNHVYCTTSCKTKASYKRNGYKYVSGHYEKAELPISNIDSNLPATNNLLNTIKELETKIEVIDANSKINSVSISNAALGSVAADATLFAAKKLFAPRALPATKGDVSDLKQEIKNLKSLLETKSSWTL